MSPPFPAFRRYWKPDTIRETAHAIDFSNRYKWLWASLGGRGLWHAGDEAPGDRAIGRRFRPLGRRGDGRAAGIGIFADGHDQRDGAQERNAQAYRRPLRPAGAEDVVAIAGIG